MTETARVSSYINYLPAIFQENQFLDQFLLAFETILSQAPPEERPALETVIGRTHTYFKPVISGDDQYRAPSEFIPWLAGWVALTLRDDWDEETQRNFIREIVPLYRQRGTKAGLKRMLEIYIGDEVPVNIYDDAADFGFEPPPHFFQVQITVSDRDPIELRRKQQIAQAIIEQEKPAHTFYALQILVPTMRLMSDELLAEQGGEKLQLGVNTLLGTQTTGGDA